VRPLFEALSAGRSLDELTAYPAAFENSWLHAELQQTKNFKLWFKKGKLIGNLMTGIEQWLLPKLGIRNPPWTLRNSKPDHLALRPAADCPRIDYPKPDGKISFDRLSSVFVSNTNHGEGRQRAGDIEFGTVRGAREPLLPGGRV
jgi:electron-transferring-flavoprotein dehydrogenase